MTYALLADVTMLVHGLFVLFVIGGGVAVLRWPRLAWLHLPAAIWGVAIEVGGWICPLTDLENRWRRLGGESGYTESYVQHYLEPLLYPLGLTRNDQVFLGILALLLNATFYSLFLVQLRRTRNSR